MSAVRLAFVAVLFITAMTAHELFTADVSFLVSESGWWLIAVGIFFYVLFIEKKSLASVGVKRPSVNTIISATIGLMVAVTLVGLAGAIAPLLGISFSKTENALKAASEAPFWVLALTVLRAGVVEELFFRGFLLARLRELGLRPLFALLLTTVLFVAPHALFWGGAHLVLVTIASLVFGALFLLRRDLIACALAHIGFNVGGLVASQLA